MHFERRCSVRAIVSDLAGTLVDHGCRAPTAAFCQVFKEFGVEISESQARGPMGLNKRDHLEAILAIPDVAAAFIAANGRPYSSADVEQMYQRFTPLQLDLLKNFSQAISGAIDALTLLRKQHIKIAINSDYARPMVEMVVDQLAAQGFKPNAFVAADDVIAGRPEPWLTLRALELLRVYPSYLAVKVGDTIPDIEEGLNAGCWTVGVLRTGNFFGLSEAEVQALRPKQLAAMLSDAADVFRKAGVHYVIESLADLPPIIGVLLTKALAMESDHEALSRGIIMFSIFSR